MDNPLVLEILQDIQTDKIKTKEEIQQELKLKLYQVYKPFLNFNSNQDNFSITYEKLQGYQFIEAKNLIEGDYVRYLNPKYFYDIQLMKGGFVSAHKVEKLLNISDLVIVNQRNILDTYISLEKAKDLVNQNVPNPWIKVNTSNLKINFEENNFRLEREKYESWYTKNLEYLQEKNIPFVRLNYESFHELNNLEKQKFLQGIWLKYLPPDLSVLEERDSEMLEKQDTSKSYEEKISNYEEFKNIFN